PSCASGSSSQWSPGHPALFPLQGGVRPTRRHPPMNYPRLAVVIVTWNVRDYIVNCLRSLYDDLARTPVPGEVWVVDNASTDGTVQAIRESFPPEVAPSLRVLEPGENLGFAAGNNLALRALGFPDGDDLPDFVFLLNPDTIVQPGALAALLDGMAQTGAGLA